MGPPVYFDVEGMPGGETYYLVGMRFKTGNSWVERSYWADTKTDERDVWRQCLTTLLGIERPQLIHYGSYESTYLARMRQRYPSTIRRKQEFDAMVDRSRNVLKTIYASIYFPTFTNGLKDIAGYLGFNWSDPTLTGSRAALFRRVWEIEPNQVTKEMLIRYNIEDCRAVHIVADAIDSFQRQLQQGTISTINLVDVETLQVPFQRTHGPFATTSPDFRRINNAAYWNYQLERVFVRWAKKPKTRTTARRKPPRPDKVVYVERTRPARCPGCRRRRIRKSGCQTQALIDLVFTRKGARRQITRQKIQRYRCVGCSEEMVAPRQKTRVGPKLQAYIIYQMFEMRLSNSQIAKQLWDIFGIRLTSTLVHEMKERTAVELEPLYRRILTTISSGPLVHVDETKAVVLGGGHYVWVFTNMSFVRRIRVFPWTRASSTARHPTWFQGWVSLFPISMGPTSQWNALNRSALST
jgi:RNase_H superfamily/Transposase IS66 family